MRKQCITNRGWMKGISVSCALGFKIALITTAHLVPLAASAHSAEQTSFTVDPDDIPNKGRIIVDHERNGRRSGHGNQALVECKNGDIIAFYSNTSGYLIKGHSNSGWSEHKISRDGGDTWSKPHALSFSLDAWYGKEFHAALVEEAVVAANGTVIAFVGRYTKPDWRRTTPAYLRSYDNGRTWSPPSEINEDVDVSQLGRTHAAVEYDNTVFVLFDSGTHFSLGNGTGHKLYVSSDHGVTFQYRSSLPFEESAWYGTMSVIGDGKLIAYAYRSDDEANIQYSISEDGGHSWSDVRTTFLSKSLRNPQMSERVNKSYFLHGRSGSYSSDPCQLVLYTSEDGIHWDDGTFLNRSDAKDLDSYSTNEVIGKYSSSGEKKLLIQSSIAYDGHARVNIHHWTVVPK